MPSASPSMTSAACLRVRPSARSFHCEPEKSTRKQTRSEFTGSEAQDSLYLRVTSDRLEFSQDGITFSDDLDGGLDGVQSLTVLPNTQISFFWIRVIGGVLFQSIK